MNLLSLKRICIIFASLMIFNACSEDNAVESSSSQIVNSSQIVYGELIDSRDNQVYKTVEIGSQIWMAENLNYAADSSFCYNNELDSCAKLGRLYTWHAEIDSVCPIGWRLPEHSEWGKINEEFTENAKSLVGRMGGTGFDVSYESGLNVIPSGFRNLDGKFMESDLIASFWSRSGEAGLSLTYNSYIYYRTHANWMGDSSITHLYKMSAMSVRCLKDIE